jgi:hypothetical protein
MKTFPAKVAAVKHGCIPSYLPIATVLAHILLFNLSENIGTNMFKKIFEKKLNQDYNHELVQLFILTYFYI